MKRPDPEPMFVAADETDFSRVCPDCVYEKNDPLHPERPGFGRGTVEEEGVVLSGTLPLDKDAEWFTCDHGHEHFVVRLGTERAANFGR